MRTLRLYAPAIHAIEKATEEITPAWIQQKTTLTKRQALDAIKMAVARKLIQFVSRGHYRRTKAA